MRGKILVVLGCTVVFLLSFNLAKAKELSLKPFLYTEDFEGKEDPVKTWVSDGKYTINFKGLTEEKAFSGKKSFKLDVTFEGGSYFYWQIPIKVPCEGNLKFTGRIFLGEESTGQADLGLNVFYPPTYHSACYHPSPSVGKGEWKLTEGDPVEFGSQDSHRAMNKWVWGAKGENVGVYVDRIGIFLYGKRGERVVGERVVVYVDDIRLEGNIPSEKDYQEEIDRRWAPYKEKFNEKISSWEKTLEESEKEIGSLSGLSPEADRMKKEAESLLFSLKEQVVKEKKRGFIGLLEKEKIDPYLEQLKTIISNIKGIQTGTTSLQDVFCYIVKPISSIKILPDSSVSGKISDTLSVIACPGEYEPASFVLYPLTDINSLKVEATPLKGKEGVIPSAAIDIRIVKCWYQAGTAWFSIRQDKSRRILTPELLLKDDSLIKVDTEKEDNYLKLSYPEGEKYVWISKEEDSTILRTDAKFHPIEEFPVKDSPVLLPANIPARTNKQFWVTVKVPDNAKPGVYTGKINFSTPEKSLGNISLKLKVLPFRLAMPKTNYSLKEDFTSSIYYRGCLTTGEGYISPKIKTKEQFRAELENMFAHGVTNPTVYQCFRPGDRGYDGYLTVGAGLEDVLKEREKVGMGSQPLCYLGVDTNSNPDTIKKVVDLTKSYKIPEVYFYGKDEARGEALISQRNAWKAVHEVGGKTFVSGYTGTFEAMGNLLDLLVWSGAPDPKEPEKWHRVGCKIWNYGNPQAGVENPEIYRRNFGFSLWKANYDGACTFAYQHCGRDKQSIWNEFDGDGSGGERDHNFTYPTMDGVIDTIAWEGYREAIDDIRYATTLRLWIEKSKNSEDREIREVAYSAEDYLEKLDRDKDLDIIRLEIISYILRLMGELK